MKFKNIFLLVALISLSAFTTDAASLVVGFNIVKKLPKGAVVLKVAGIDYHYHKGHYYKKTPRGYVVARAPHGAVVRHLPKGHVRVVINGRIYYRYDTVFYQKGPRGYIVVKEPVSQIESETVIDESNTFVWKDGHKFELIDGEFFNETPNGLEWVAPPYGGNCETDLTPIAQVVWHEDIKYYLHNGAVFKETPSGFRLIPEPWE